MFVFVKKEEKKSDFFLVFDPDFEQKKILLTEKIKAQQAKLASKIMYTEG